MSRRPSLDATRSSGEPSRGTAPFSNHITPDGTRNALPPGDLISRGTFLELLVAQSLLPPCQNQDAPVGPPFTNLQAIDHALSTQTNQFPRFQPV